MIEICFFLTEIQLNISYVAYSSFHTILQLYRTVTVNYSNLLYLLETFTIYIIYKHIYLYVYVHRKFATFSGSTLNASSIFLYFKKDIPFKNQLYLKGTSFKFNCCLSPNMLSENISNNKRRL